MEEKNNLLSGLFSNSSNYFDLQGRSIRLGFYQKSTLALTTGIQLLIIIVFAVVTYLFLNIGLAFLLGSLTGSLMAGFFILGGLNLAFLIIYSLTRHSIGEKKIRNSVLQNISETHHDYEELVKEQERLKAELDVAGTNLRDSANEIKEKLSELEVKIAKLKEQFLSGNTSTEGGSIARTVVTTGIDILLNTFVLRNAGLIKRTLVPVITNAFVTSRVFKEKGRTSLLENLKLKFRKLLK